ncbi:hypothetical protein LSAT2_001439 [Lamellibrachia satsuma]|nr:hypothetical protein LSAT2_001439 [Lamellibrachia satsuma]
MLSLRIDSTTDIKTFNALKQGHNRLQHTIQRNTPARTSLKWIQPSVDEHGLTRSIPVTQVNKKTYARRC